MTALASCGTLLIAAEGPFLRFYDPQNSRYIASERVFKAQAVHGIAIYSEAYDDVIKFVVWGGRFIRALEISFTSGIIGTALDACLSAVLKAPDWILDLAPCLSSLEDENEYKNGSCVVVTAHNALIQVTITRHHADIEPDRYALSAIEPSQYVVG